MIKPDIYGVFSMFYMQSFILKVWMQKYRLTFMLFWSKYRLKNGTFLGVHFCSDWSFSAFLIKDLYLLQTGNLSITVVDENIYEHQRFTFFQNCIFQVMCYVRNMWFPFLSVVMQTKIPLIKIHIFWLFISYSLADGITLDSISHLNKGF